jgi:hypothetical protein
MLFVHNGREPFHPQLFTPVQNQHDFGFPNQKPIGGMWLSPYTPDEEYVSDWVHWASMNYTIHDHNYLYDVDMSRVYVINAYEDLRSLLDRFPLSPPPKMDFLGRGLDFESISKEYSGIFVTPSGIVKCKHPWLSLEKCSIRDIHLSSWDVSSLLLFDPSVLTFVRELS